MTTALRYAARTHLGLGPKSRNEDSGYAGPHLLVLADGMGGHAAGDVASSMIVGALAPLDEEIVSGEQALRVLESELREANAQLRAAMREDSGLAGMGATTIAMSATDAERIGLKYRDGQRGMASTAGGMVPIYRVNLTSVRVGEVEVRNVDAIIVPGQMSHVLLGNSFLTRFQMRRESDVMTLELRY